MHSPEHVRTVITIQNRSLFGVVARKESTRKIVSMSRKYASGSGIIKLPQQLHPRKKTATEKSAVVGITNDLFAAKSRLGRLRFQLQQSPHHLHNRKLASELYLGTSREQSVDHLRFPHLRRQRLIALCVGVVRIASFCNQQAQSVCVTTCDDQGLAISLCIIKPLAQSTQGFSDRRSSSFPTAQIWRDSLSYRCAQTRKKQLD